MGIVRKLLAFLGLVKAPDRREHVVQEIEKRRPHKPISPKTEVKLTVGLDFGTSTIKCIVLAQIGDRRREDRFVVPIDGLCLFPAVCWEHDGRIFTRKRPPSVYREFRSPKACLRCEILGEDYPDPTYRDSGYSPSAISWVLLSHCVRDLRHQIRERFPVGEYQFDWQEDVFWNMGAPVDGMKHEHLRKHFAELLWLSVNYAFDRSSEGKPCAGLSDRYEALNRDFPPPIEDSDGLVYAGNCFVFPEAHVAVNAFLHLRGNLDPGLYFACDIGAGTTDIAFFRFAPRVERPVVFYEASSRFAGGDAIARELSRIEGLDLEAANQKIMQGLSNEELVALSSALERLRKEIDEARRVAFGLAYNKERQMHTWKEQMQGAAVLGGGANFPEIRRQCVAPFTPVEGETIRVADIPLRKAMLAGATELHRMAFGLSIPPTQFYPYWRPDQVESLPPRERERYNPFPWGSPYEK
jgi:hypothetical protein